VNTEEDSKPKVKKGTTAYHVVKFIEVTMDILDKQNKKGVFIMMDNCRIHHSDFVIEAINKRGYKPLLLPPYSPFLNPIEECWAKVKTNTRRNQLSKVDQLTPRIAAACATVTAEDCQGWIRHSKTFWDRCLSKELLLC
jgi:transposase